MIPERHFMMSLIQNYLDKKKNKVTILTCGGTKGFSCSLNVLGNRQLCKACISIRNNSISKLKGSFKVIEIKKNFFFPLKYNKKKITELKINNINFGLGVYASYTNTSRDTYIEGEKSKKIIQNLLNTSYSFYKFFQKFSKLEKIDEFIQFNSRMSEKRAIFDYACKKKINISNYEKLSIERFYNFKDHLSQDRKFIKKQVLKFQNKNDKNFEKEKKFFSDKFYSKKDPINSKVYTSNQNVNELPKEWSLKNKNIVFFTCSDDEHLSFGKEYTPLFAVNQKHLLEKTCEIFHENSNYILWIRIHPSLRNSNWFDRDFYKCLEKNYNNVVILYPEETISSYAIMLKAYNVICFWSLLLVESAYWRKTKTISLTKNDMTELGIAIVPETMDQYKKLIFNKFKEKKEIQIKALNYIKFYINAGSKIKYFKGTIQTGYTFKKFNLKPNYFEKINYIMGKIEEKIKINFFNKKKK